MAMFLGVGCGQEMSQVGVPLDAIGTPAQYDSVQMSRNFGIGRLIRTKVEVPAAITSSANVELVDGVVGFEDVIGAPLGAGFFYNTPNSVHQLTFVLSITLHPVVAELVAKRKAPPQDVVRELREHQVLAGMKIMDLGCGAKPGFALAAKALGAEVYTADVNDLRPDLAAKLDGHVTIDLNHSNAPAVLAGVISDDFDVISENIIGGNIGIGQERSAKMPNFQTISAIGATLLKSGGYLFCLSVGGFSAHAFQKT